MGKKRYGTLTQHHRKCRSNGGTNDKSNISWVPDHKHKAWHTLFENKSAHEIANIINEAWLDPEYEFIVVRRKHGS